MLWSAIGQWRHPPAEDDPRAGLWILWFRWLFHRIRLALEALPVVEKV